MVIRHSIYYFLAKGLPGVINLAALMLFTRMLTPETYGQYSLVIAGVSLGYVVLYQWLQLGILRFYPQYKEKNREFLTSIFLTFLLITIVVTLLVLFSLLFIESLDLKLLYAVGIIVLWFWAFHELNLELVRIQSKPSQYAVYGFIKSIGTITLGALFIWIGLQTMGVLAGMLIALLLSSIRGAFKHWPLPNVKFFDLGIIQELLKYGLPLIATFALSFIISSSDRFIIGWILNTEAVGEYSAGYDITSHTLGIIMVIINLAAYPLVIQALESKGEVEARGQLSKNFTLLMAVSIPATVGLAVLAAPVAGVFLGESFRGTAITLIPWVAAATLLSGLKAYYFDLSFQLGKKTYIQIWSVAIAAVVNIILNMLWIPLYGVLGAAYATLGAYMAALIVSIVLGKKVFELPVPLMDLIKIILAALVMGLVISAVPYDDIGNIYISLLASSLVGCVSYILMMLVLNASHSRAYLRSLLPK
jgi:O-antigen/teichoic acid export membrane protein